MTKTESRPEYRESVTAAIKMAQASHKQAVMLVGSLSLSLSICEECIRMGLGLEDTYYHVANFKYPWVTP